MAWLCSANSNLQLLKNLKEANILTHSRILDAMAKVDRKYYASDPFRDSPQTIGYGATISAPHMHAYALEYLNVQENEDVLDVGCGSGYLTSVFSYLTKGKVTGIDHIPELVELSETNIKNGNPEVLNKVELYCADGRHGFEKNAPYDVIHVGAAATNVLPELIEQLKDGGRLFIPVGKQFDTQDLMLVTKSDLGIHKEKLMNVMYVPLTDKENQVE